MRPPCGIIVHVGVDQASAALRIHREGGGSAADVTARLCLEPSVAHDVGESRSARDPRLWTSAHWSLKSVLPDSEPLAEHLAWLLDRVSDKGRELQSLADDGYELDWFCLIGFEGGQGGVLLPADLLVRLASLPIELNLDLYG